MNKKIYLFLIFLSIFFLLLSFFIKNPVTTPVVEKLQKINILPLSENDLKIINSKGVYINFPNKSIFYTLDEVGIKFNFDKNLEKNDPIFTDFKNKLEQELKYLVKNPVIDIDNFKFYGLGEGGSVLLNEEKFLAQVSFEKTKSLEELRIRPYFDEVFIPENNQKQNETLVQKMLKTPLQLKAGRRTFNIRGDEIKGFLIYERYMDKEVIQISTDKISDFLKVLNQKTPFPTEVDYEEASKSLAKSLLFRLTEENPSKVVILPIQGTYSKNPDMHPKFIEVNKSQQRAYLFEGGKLYRTLIISTGLTWETPAGEFKVLNKVPMTISYTNNWYMPWYLPIGTMMGNYYFGFHEVPYQVSYNGLIYSRDPETIGSPATGGCIQILKGQAEEVFKWAEVGIPVYITE
jgi:hypothetical protein